MIIRQLPLQITAGLTLDLRLSFRAYSAASWSGSLLLRGPASIDLTASADGNEFVFHADASATATWAPGDYWCSVRVTSGDEVKEAQNGKIRILPDIANLPVGYDGSTYAERVLAAIEAVIERRASLDQESYKINNRELSRTPISDLLTLRDQFKREVGKERAAKAGRNPFNRRVKVVLK
ncbi:hypothetical protein DEI76_19045 [Salmonella enterica subsp. enterica serovar Agona]|nr:hypothetical protein [Salmonella enterica subsp. enterica serovar Agona]MBH0755574.1 hypothetical protein [Salmonella enterica]